MADTTNTISPELRAIFRKGLAEKMTLTPADRIAIQFLSSLEAAEAERKKDIAHCKFEFDRAEEAEAENARLTAQLAALTGQQEDCKLHPCPYSREGLNCGVISLANNRAHEGMVENMRLTAERDWLANRLACIQSSYDIDQKTKDWSTERWIEAARRAVGEK